MRLHGWCEKCHRPRMVTVSGRSLARMGRGVPTGVCMQCEEKERKQREERRKR